jgi:hypothetical protein
MRLAAPKPLAGKRLSSIDARENTKEAARIGAQAPCPKNRKKLDRSEADRQGQVSPYDECSCYQQIKGSERLAVSNELKEAGAYQRQGWRALVPLLPID